MKFATSPRGDTARVSAKDHTTRQKTDIKEMRFLTNIVGNKKERVERTIAKSTEYFIDIEPNSNCFSTAFKDFLRKSL